MNKWIVWLRKNGNWVFSGVGVAAVSGIVSLLNHSGEGTENDISKSSSASIEQAVAEGGTGVVQTGPGAFDNLVCSDNPNLRNYAIKEGLKKSADPLVRNQVMLKAMMQKKRIDIEMNSKKELTKDDKEFIKTHSGVYSLPVYYGSEKEGCISLYSRDRCDTSYSVFIKGDKLEYNYRYVFGEFQLSQAGELVGYLRVHNTSKYSRIPAVIKLF